MHSLLNENHDDMAELNIKLVITLCDQMLMLIQMDAVMFGNCCLLSSMLLHLSCTVNSKGK
jgi:membrane protein required for beta-lactamase induction